MKKYHVLVVEIVGGWCEVEATTKEEAEKIALKKLEHESTNCIFDATYRECDVVGETKEVSP